MKKLFLLLCIMTYSNLMSQGPTTDYIKTKDFNLHTYYGMTTGTIGAVANDALNINAPNWAAFLATSTFAGTVKELYDTTKPGGRFSIEDWGATLFGGTVAWVFDEIVDWIGIDRKYTRFIISVSGVTLIGFTFDL